MFHWQNRGRNSSRRRKEKNDRFEQKVVGKLFPRLDSFIISFRTIKYIRKVIKLLDLLTETKMGIRKARIIIIIFLLEEKIMIIKTLLNFF